MTVQSSRLPVFTALLIIVVSTGLALAALTVLLMLLPEPFFGPVSWLTRTTMNQSMTVTWRPSDGDVYAALPGQVRPPVDDTPYASFVIEWDEHGFRREAVAHEAHPIALFGDSFTEGFNVEFPYADRLAAALGVGVQNYGYRAYGPDEIAETAAQFIPAEPREWVIWGYFSGNDLGDAMRPPRLDTGNPLALWSALLAKTRPHNTPAPLYGADGQPHYNQPVPVIIGANYYDMAFVSYYGWWQQTPPDAAQSHNAAKVAAALDAIEAAGGNETCRAVAFIPPKEMLYAPYIYPTERVYLNAMNQRIVMDPATGALTFSYAPVTDEDAYFASLYAHRDLIAGMVTARDGWTFIDLVPAFEQAAADGDLLYFAYDTHWTQAGHDLAAQVIAEAIQAGC